jgi:hypothetical protein
MPSLPAVRRTWSTTLLALAALAAAGPVLAAGAARELVPTAPLLSVVMLVVVATTTAVVSACVLLHYETLRLLSLVLLRFHRKRRRRILVLMFALLTLAIVEIWMFGIAYDVLMSWPGYGALHGPGAADEGLFDHVYFSASVYTTLGLGDLVPSGSIRFMVGTEALVGFTLVSWSAAFTFLEMERFWRDSTAQRHRAAYGASSHDDAAD